MHKQWLQIEQAYIQSNRIFNYAQLRLQGRWRAVWPTLVVAGLLIALSGTLFVWANPLWPIACVTGVALCMMVFFRTLDRLLGRLYPQEYEQYGIARQRMSERCDYLAYALFFQRVIAMGHSPRTLQAISDYSQTLGPPPKPFLINQHFTTVIMVSILVSLLSAYLQKTPGWSTQALEYIATALGLTFVLSLGLDDFASHKPVTAAFAATCSVHALSWNTLHTCLQQPTRQPPRTTWLTTLNPGAPEHAPASAAPRPTGNATPGATGAP